MASGGIYEGLDEIGRLVASLDAQMNLHNTSPVFGVGNAPDLGFEGSVLHAKVSWVFILVSHLFRLQNPCQGNAHRVDGVAVVNFTAYDDVYLRTTLPYVQLRVAIIIRLQGAACAGVVLAEGGAPTKMSAIEVDGAIYCAIKATERIEKNGELGVLTRDMAAAIYLYTMDCNFYKQLNKLLREEDRTALKPFFPYLRLLLLALRRLPKEQRTVYRGVKLNLKEDYTLTDHVIWWSLISTTNNMAVLSEPQFLGEAGQRTIFAIEVKSARNIQKYSAIKKENELLLLPGTPFNVKAVLPQGDLTMIQLEEDTSAPPMIDSGEDAFKECTPKSFYSLVADAETAPDSEYATPAELGIVDTIHVVPAKKSLGSQPWFRAHFTRAQVTELLTDANTPVGTFFVRNSSRKGMVAVSIVFGERIQHVLFKPEMRNDPESGQVIQMFKFGDNGDTFFPSIPMMIEHFMVNPYTVHPTTGERVVLKAPDPIKVDTISKGFSLSGLGAGTPTSYSTRHVGEPWYVANMDREECKKAVTSGDPGDFLVRDSSDGKKMVIVLNGRGARETANYQIVPGDNLMYIVGGVPYRHVSEVLQSMRDNDPNGNDGKPLPLGNVAKYG